MTHLCPYFDFITESFIPYLADGAQTLGNHFFDTTTVPLAVVNPILEFFDELNLGSNLTVISGISTGGVISKTVGMLRKKISFSFWSFPVFDNAFSSNFNFEKLYSLYFTNIYNFGGVLLNRSQKLEITLAYLGSNQKDFH